MNNVQKNLNFRKSVVDSICRCIANVPDANESNAPMVVELIVALSLATWASLVVMDASSALMQVRTGFDCNELSMQILSFLIDVIIN